MLKTPSIHVKTRNYKLTCLHASTKPDTCHIFIFLLLLFFKKLYDSFFWNGFTCLVATEPLKSLNYGAHSNHLINTDKDERLSPW